MIDVAPTTPLLTPEELFMATRLALLELDAKPLTLREFASKVNPRFVWYRHCEALAEKLEAVVAGDIRRLMVYMPPRHGKSELVSRILPAYYLYRHPDRWVGLASYGAELAYKMSRAARQNYLEAGSKLAGDAAAVREWETGKGGGMWADGAGGALTGKGFHLGIVDDPTKNAEEASSKTVQEMHREWWRSTFYTREEPGGAIVVCMTRWHEDDLAGWLLSEEDDAPEGWTVMSLPAIAEDAASEFPVSCPVVPDWREVGEALCPERYPADKLAKIRSKIGTYYWSALYSQRPGPKEGKKFKREWFPIVDAAPAQARRVRAWDKAATDGAGDWTAGVRMAVSEGVYYVEDVVRGQWSDAPRDKSIRQTAELDGHAVTVRGPQDPGAAGKSDAAAFTRLLAGFAVKTLPVTGDKELRAGPLASQAEAGNVKLVRGAWNKAYLDELCGFPTGKHDDQVDASADAFNELTMGDPPRVVAVARW